MNKLFIIILVFIGHSAMSQKPVIVGDITVNYAVSDLGTPSGNGLKETSKTLYIKGKVARADFISSDYKQTIIYDNKTGNAVILKELGSAKYITRLNADQWKKENERFEGMTVILSDEKQMIIGYDCKKATLTLKDGSVYYAYYTSSIIPSTTENPYQFKDIPGLVLEFETSPESKSKKIKFTALSVNLSPVPASKFELPTTGFRVIEQ